MKNIFRSILLVLLMMALAACGGEEVDPEATSEPEATAVEETAADPTAEAVDEITPEPLPEEPTVAAEPTAAEIAATAVPEGVELLLQFQDTAAGPLSSVGLDLTQMPAAAQGKVYAVWLVDDAGNHLLLGAANGGETFKFSDPEGRNLAGLYSGAVLSLEAPANVTAGGLATPTDVAASGSIPVGVVGLVRQLVVSAEDTPDNKPYVAGLAEQAEVAATHAELALDGIAEGDFAVARIHLEHVNNILVGNESEEFGDLNGDGDPQNPGDGYGVRPYAFQTAVTAGTIAEPGLPDHIREAAAGIVTCAANISDNWGPEATELTAEGLNAADAAAAEGPGLDLTEVTDAIWNGRDENENGEIEIAVDECGAAQIEALAGQLLTIPMTVAEGAATGGVGATEEPTEAAAPAEVTVSMIDFEFVPIEVSVPAGTTVTWTNDGAAPHSATAVDGSFDTGVYDAGQSASVTFDTPGSYAYYCTLHGTPDGTAGMVGTVIVNP